MLHLLAQIFLTDGAPQLRRYYTYCSWIRRVFYGTILEIPSPWDCALGLAYKRCHSQLSGATTKG